MSEFITIKESIKRLSEGEMLIVQDGAERENEGDLMVAAEKVTPEIINFMMKHGRGLVCMPMAGELLDQIGVPMMVKNNLYPFRFFRGLSFVDYRYSNAVANGRKKFSDGFCSTAATTCIRLEFVRENIDLVFHRSQGI